jgi:hypothetical protein
MTPFSESDPTESGSGYPEEQPEEVGDDQPERDRKGDRDDPPGAANEDEGTATGNPDAAGADE